MKNIAILEDDPFIVQQLVKIVGEMGYLVGAHTSNPEEFILYVKKEKPELLLLDVNLEQEKDGIDTAKEIRSFSESSIVFITSYFDDLTLSRIRDIGPEGFVLKPFREIDVKINLNLALTNRTKQIKIKVHENESPLFIKQAGEMVKVDPNSVLYLKGEDNYTFVHFEDGSKHTVSTTLKSIGQQFSVYGFKRIHKSYVINLSHLRTVSGSIVSLGGENIPIGKAYKKELLAELNII